MLCYKLWRVLHTNSYWTGNYVHHCLTMCLITLGRVRTGLIKLKILYLIFYQIQITDSSAMCCVKLISYPKMWLFNCFFFLNFLSTHNWIFYQFMSQYMLLLYYSCMKFLVQYKEKTSYINFERKSGCGQGKRTLALHTSKIFLGNTGS